MPEAMRQLPLGVRLQDRARFASFLPGPNSAVLAQLQALATTPRAGLAWLHGPASSGKSHLLQALCAAAGSEAAYLPLLQLSAQGCAALADWRGARWLCVDEVGLAIGHPAWERALFALYRDAEERGASLLLATREPPQALGFALPDLASRCAAGQRLALLPLDEAGQRAALSLRAQLRGLELPEETAQFLQRRLPRELASLLAALDELDAAALAEQRRLTVPFVRAVLGEGSALVARGFRVVGRVQGVWFRRATAARAQALGLRGEVRNEADGSVAVLAQGTAAAVAELGAWLWVGSADSQVQRVEEQPVPAAALTGSGFRTV
jgi:DnaA family protein